MDFVKILFRIFVPVIISIEDIFFPDDTVYFSGAEGYARSFETGLGVE